MHESAAQFLSIGATGLKMVQRLAGHGCKRMRRKVRITLQPVGQSLRMPQRYIFLARNDGCLSGQVGEVFGGIDYAVGGVIW